MALVTTRTRAELKEAIGRILHILGAGENTLSAEDDLVIDDRVDDILMELSQEGLITFDVTDNSAIDIASFRSIAEIAAASLVNDFELPPQDANRILVQERQARLRLKRMVFDGINDATVKTEYF